MDQLKIEMNNFEFVRKAQVEEVVNNFEILITLAKQLSQHSQESISVINSCAVNFLNAFAYNLYGYFWLLLLEKAKQHEHSSLQKNRHLCEFYFDHMMPRVTANIRKVESLEHSIMAMPTELF